jgi:hypothetical protein
MSGQAAATGERVARAAASKRRWQLTFMLTTVPATRPDGTTIQAGTTLVLLNALRGTQAAEAAINQAAVVLRKALHVR